MRLNKLAAFSCMSLTLACTGAAKADSFSACEYVTYDQGDWGLGGSSSALLSVNYAGVFASTNDVLILGVVGTSGEYYVAFTNAEAAGNYMPSDGLPAPLTQSLTNPPATASDEFPGNIEALELDVAFNQAGLLGTSTNFGDLVLTNFTGSLSTQELNGLTIDQFLGLANICLSGGACPAGVNNVDAITEDLYESFEDGTESSFADTNLALPSSGAPTTTPEPSSLLLLAPGLVGLGFLKRQRRLLRGPP